jgi:hypothetical protein
MVFDVVAPKLVMCLAVQPFDYGLSLSLSLSLSLTLSRLDKKHVVSKLDIYLVFLL